MSGGRFDYIQYRMPEIAEDIENVLERQGKERPKEELHMNSDWYVKYPEEKLYPTYSEEVQKALKAGAQYIKRTHIFINRIDRFLSGDDGEESFIKRLQDELSNLKLE